MSRNYFTEVIFNMSFLLKIYDFKENHIIYCCFMNKLEILICEKVTKHETTILNYQTTTLTGNMYLISYCTWVSI